MSEISKYVEEQYNRLVGEESMPISEDSVREAIRCIDDFDLKDSKSLFTIVAALNLLNAAIKKDDLKSTLYYSYIKNNVSKVADYYLSNSDKFEDVVVYYEIARKCLFLKIYDVVFSFHQIKETNKIISIATNSKPIVWPGIRLQRIAQSVFEYGKYIEKRNASVNIEKKNYCCPLKIK